MVMDQMAHHLDHLAHVPAPPSHVAPPLVRLRPHVTQPLYVSVPRTARFLAILSHSNQH